MTARPAMVLTFARRGEEDDITRALALLAQREPGAPVAAVGTPTSEAALRALGLTDVIVFGSPGQSAFAALRAARARRPRAAVVLYRGPGAQGHLKLELLALALGAARIYRTVAGEDIRPVSKIRLGISVTGKLLGAGGCLLAGGGVAGVAWCWLRVAQMLAGGGHARRH